MKQMVRKRPRRARVPLVRSGESIVEEALPFPIVHYPPDTGAFLAFAPAPDAPVVLCSCAQAAVEYALRLHAPAAGGAMQRGLPAALFPESAVVQSRANPEDGCEAVSFVRGLCHRCNLTAPGLRYCHDAEGGRFIQHYGWYVAQAYYRFGIQPGTFAYLEDAVPEALEPSVIAVERATEALDRAGGILGDAEDQAADAGSREEMLRLAQRRFVSRMYRRACSSLDRAIENVVREEFGFARVGEGRISEAQLYRVVCRMYPDREVLRRQRPSWLGGLELDIYVPDLSLAFEYQGQQHFYPVEAWGGEEAFEALQERDARKAGLCVENGVCLVAIDYTEPLIERHVRARVAEARA